MPRADHRRDPGAPGRDLRRRRCPGDISRITDKVIEEKSDGAAGHWTAGGFQ